MIANITDLHWPDKDEAFTYAKVHLQRRGRPKILDKLAENLKPRQLHPGLADWARENQFYKMMLEDFKINEMNNKEILDEFMSYHDLTLLKESSVQDQEMKIESENSIMEQKASRQEDFEEEVIFLRISKGWSLSSLKAKYCLDDQKLNEIFLHFKKRLQEAKTEHRRWLSSRKCKLQPHHIEWIREFCEQNAGQRITWKTVRAKLLEIFEDLSNISLWTIARCLKSKLKMSYRRFESRPIAAFRNEIIRKLFESASLQIKLDKRNIEMIFVDEFKLSSKHWRFRGWAPKCRKGFIKSYSDSFHASFIVALSQKKIYGIMASDITFNASMFQRFIEHMLIMRNKDKESSQLPFIIVLDNNSIHNASAVQKYLKSTKVSWLTIAQYCPWLNPWEKLIGAIKQKVANKKAEGK